MKECSSVVHGIIQRTLNDIVGTTSKWKQNIYSKEIHHPLQVLKKKQTLNNYNP